MIRPVSEQARVKTRQWLSTGYGTFALATVCLTTVAFTFALVYASIYDSSPVVLLGARLYPSLATLYRACVVISFYLLGAAVKFVDDAFDRNRFSREAANYVTGVSIVLALALTWLDIWVASLLLGLLIAVTVSGKVNNRLFLISAVAFFCLLVAFGDFPQLKWALVGLAATAALADELGAEFAKSRFRKPEPSPEVSSQIREKVKAGILYVLRNRVIVFLVLLVAAIIQLIPFLYWVAWAALDVGYTVIEAISIGPRALLRTRS